MANGRELCLRTLAEPVYLRRPKNAPGMDSSRMWKCTKALYGLRPAGKAWYHHIDYVSEMGSESTVSVPPLFKTPSADGRERGIALYVDDIPVAAETQADYLEVLRRPNEVWKVNTKDRGEVKELCGTEFTKAEDG